MTLTQRNLNHYISNCYADMEVIDFLLDNVKSYKEVLIIRHHKFVSNYLKFNKNMKMLCLYFQYSQNEMQRIFWRIQRQLSLAFVNQVFERKIRNVQNKPEKLDDFLFWYLSESTSTADNILSSVNKLLSKSFIVDGLGEKRKKKVEDVLNTLLQYSDIDQFLPTNVYLMFNDLRNGKPLTQVAKDHNKQFNYLVTSIIGTSSNRSACERGWLAYIQYKLNKQKIVQFPNS